MALWQCEGGRVGRPKKMFQMHTKTDWSNGSKIKNKSTKN